MSFSETEIIAFLLGWSISFILMWLRTKAKYGTLERRFLLVDQAVREAQEALIDGFPEEARDHLRSILPENVGIRPMKDVNQTG